MSILLSSASSFFGIRYDKSLTNVPFTTHSERASHSISNFLAFTAHNSIFLTLLAHGTAPRRNTRSVQRLSDIRNSFFYRSFQSLANLQVHPQLSLFSSSGSYRFNTSSHWFNVSSHWFNVSSHWFNVSSHWFNDSSHWFNVSSHWFNDSSYWFNVSSHWFNDSSHWFNVSSHWFNTCSYWFNTSSHWFNDSSNLSNTGLYWFNTSSHRKNTGMKRHQQCLFLPNRSFFFLE